MHKVGVIGDRDSVLFFRALGFEVYPVMPGDTEETRKLVDKLARSGFGAIFITEQIVLELGETIDRYEKQMSPAIIPIPSNTGSLGVGLKRISDNVEKAVGINILD